MPTCRKNGRRVVSAFIAAAFARDTSAALGKQWRHIADRLRAKLRKFAALLDEALIGLVGVVPME
jgi:hypothetical protein